MPPKPATKVNKRGETMYLSPGGNSYTTQDPNRTTASYTPIAGENAGKRVELKADGTKSVGIVTSRDAENRGKSANETLTSITTPSSDVENPFGALFTRLSTLQAELTKAQEAEKAAKDEAAGVDAKSGLKKINSAEEVATEGKADLNAAADALGGNGNSQNIQDPVIRALTDKTIANIGIINNQMQTLGQYRQQFNEYTQEDIDSISRTAERAVQRQIEENKRTTDAMRFAGVIGGRAQFAPVTEQTIIHEVIQDGLDEIEVINEKKNSAIREARKAEAEFNIKAFEQQATLAKEYNNEIESTISKMNAQVRQVEADEREKIRFRDEQEKKNSLILASELLDATPEQIEQAAAANGISYGALAKAVNDAKFEATSRELDIKSKQESILTSQTNRQLDLARFNREGQKTEEIKIPADVEQGLRSVAQLSKGDAETVWTNIQDYGLNRDTVLAWLDTGKYSKAQVKAIVSAHEQSQRPVVDVDGTKTVQPTDTEKALHSVVEQWAPTDNRPDSIKALDKFEGQVIQSRESFFKNR